MDKKYGKEVILDLHQCEPNLMSRENIDKYFKTLCKKIEMIKCKRVWWDDHGVAEEFKQTSPHTVGVTAVQFILTSNITIHTLPLLRKVFINIFSCKDFNAVVAMEYSMDAFDSRQCRQMMEIDRL